MPFDKLDSDIIEQILEYLTFSDELKLASAFGRNDRYVNLLRQNKPLTVFASSLVPARKQETLEPANETRTASFDCSVVKDRYENWLPIPVLEQPWTSCTLIDLTFCISQPEDIYFIKRALSKLKAKNIESVSYVIELIYDEFLQALGSWSDLSTFNNEPCQKLRTLHIKNDTQSKVLLPKCLEIKELIIEGVPRIARLPTKVSKLRIVNSRFVKSRFAIPKEVQFLEIEVGWDMHLYTDLILEIVLQIVRTNRRTLRHVTILCASYCSIDEIMSNMMNAPELIKIKTNCTFDRKFDCAFKYHFWGLQSTEKFDQSITNTWVRPVVKTFLDCNGSLQQNGITEVLGPWNYQTPEKIPCYLKILRVELGRGLTPHKLPFGIEELYVKANGEFPFILEKESRLRVLELLGYGLDLLETLPKNLTHIVGDMDHHKYTYAFIAPSLLPHLQKTPRLKNLVLKNVRTISCDWPLVGLQSLSIDASGSFILSNFPKSMTRMNLSFKNDPRDPFQTGRVAINCSRNPYEFNLSAIGHSNLKYLQLELPRGMTRTFPENTGIALPATLEVLIYNTNVDGTVILKFPSHSNTNLKSVEFVNSERTGYSFQSMGHGSNGTRHNKLEYICAWTPPIGNFDCDGNFIFTERTPPNIRQVRCKDHLYLNPAFYSEDDRSRLKSEYVWVYNLHKK